MYAMDYIEYQKMLKESKNKRNPYQNTKSVTIEDNGKVLKFGSIPERSRWVLLRLLEKAGQIKDLMHQPKYIFKFRKTGKRMWSYTADFSYYDNEEENLVVEDVKPDIKNKSWHQGDSYQKFKRNCKMMLDQYEIFVREVH